MDYIYKATRAHEGRIKKTVYAWDADTAKTLIRNHVSIKDPGWEWVEMDRKNGDGWVLSGAADDVEVVVRKVRLHGYPYDHTNDT